MDASDLIKSMQRQPCEEGAIHIWGPDADRRAKLLMFRAAKGSILAAYSHFEVFLVGKDGHTAVSSDKPRCAEDLFARVDAMPMRQDEMRRGRWTRMRTASRVDR
jgi:hypothetical protein